MHDPRTTPVIVGVGEVTDRPSDPAQALEPLALMERALRAAEADAAAELLSRLDSLDLVGLISWRYRDPVNELCNRMSLTPAQRSNASMGGETPIRLIHEAALKIAQGSVSVAAIVGAEAMHARGRAQKAGVALNWTPQPRKEESFAFASSRFALSPVAARLNIRDPAQIYPFYEMATQAAWGQNPAEAQAESAALWAQYAAVAAANPFAWIQTAPTAGQIGTVSADNRLINWPYPKLMVANPSVNQGAAVIVTSLALAREAGVPDERIIHIWGGAAANEPEDYLQRDRYDRSSAQAAVLQAAVTLAGGTTEGFGAIELYSCFPVVPKMARRTLGLAANHPTTVTGGLTFFGGPLNNYMTHAVCAMVRRLREDRTKPGLLYGQGGYVYKHHALVLGAAAAPDPLAPDPSVQAQADAGRGPVPAVLDIYNGPATVETYTLCYGRDGTPLHGIVILKTPEGARTMAKVAADDDVSMAALLATDQSAVGSLGHVRTDTFGEPVWELGDQPRDRRQRTLKFCTVERDGPLTVVTMNRPETMNALHPASNAELAELFDEFAADPDQWVAILTGAGEKAFCSGNDLKFTAVAMARGESILPPLTGFAGLTARFDLNKPVIAAVNGVAMGGGFEIALACDLIIASRSASFALPEPKVGLAAVAGGLLRLPQLIGEKAAMGMILTGRKVSAEEGERLGFVNEVAEPEALMTTARRWAAEIIACSPMSIRASKEVLRRGRDTASLAEAYAAQNRAPAVKALFRSADFREGPLAFSQKRAPRWTGR